MKKKTVVALLLAGTLTVGSAAAFAGCGNGDGKATGITVWVSEIAGAKTLTQNQVKDFFKANPDYDGKYKVTVEGMSESESATKMITDVATGADIYCFAQDQLGRLVEAEALAKLGVQASKFVADNNDKGAANTAKIGNDTYCYPITSDNGYFMYYDKSVITNEEHLNDLNALVADCEAAGKGFAFELEGSAWYNASFFFGVGCKSSWSFDAGAKKWAVADTFNSDKGIIALKGMQILTKSSAYINSSKTAEFGDGVVKKDEDGNDVYDDDGNLVYDVKGGAAIVVSGTWDSGTAKEKLGTNFAAAKLPSFTVDGQTYQLGSYSGNKLLGVKPHTDANVQAFCNALAQYLSGKECQEARFTEFGWGPSNKEAQELDEVKADVTLTALRAQNEFATPQGTIHGGWWDFAKLLGTVSKDAKSDADLQAGLDSYQASLDKYTSMSEEAMETWGVVGSIASLAGVTENLAENQTTWANWSTDIVMAKTETDDGIVWKSVVKITLAAGDEFKVRKGQDWNTNYGIDGMDSGNYVITADNAGDYYVVLTLDSKGENGVLSIEAAE